MLLTASEISSDQASDSWFCLGAQPKREHIAAACLRQISEVEVFCPRVRFRKSTNRGPVWFIESMFPGYCLPDLIFKRSIARSAKDPVLAASFNSGNASHFCRTHLSAK